jgi:hypothetical protein
MPTKRTTTDTTADTTADIDYPQRGLIGPADTTDATVRVSSTPPAPSDTDLRTGRVQAATAVGHHRDPAAPAPLRLATEPRTETYEVEAPGGTIVKITRNIDTGQHSIEWTDRSVHIAADET